jgi:hypothetical protein
MPQTTINDLPLLPQQLIGQDFYAYVTTPTGGDFIAKLGEIVAQMQASEGQQIIKVAKLFIPAAEVLTLGTTPKPFGLSVPAGHYVKPLGCDVFISGGTTAYATNGLVGIRTVGASQALFETNPNFLFTTATANGQMQLTPDSQGDVQFIAATDVEAFMAADPTAGDRDITLYLTYTLIEL